MQSVKQTNSLQCPRKWSLSISVKTWSLLVNAIVHDEEWLIRLKCAMLKTRHYGSKKHNFWSRIYFLILWNMQQCESAFRSLDAEPTIYIVFIVFSDQLNFLCFLILNAWAWNWQYLFSQVWLVMILSIRWNRSSITLNLVNATNSPHHIMPRNRIVIQSTVSCTTISCTRACQYILYVYTVTWLSFTI